MHLALQQKNGVFFLFAAQQFVLQPIYYYNVMPSVLWCCWLGGRKGIRPVETEWWGVGSVICLEQGANDLHMIQLMPLPPHHLLFLMPAYPGCHGKEAIKQVSVLL